MDTLAIEWLQSPREKSPIFHPRFIQKTCHFVWWQTPFYWRKMVTETMTATQKQRQKLTLEFSRGEKGDRKANVRHKPWSRRGKPQVSGIRDQETKAVTPSPYRNSPLPMSLDIYGFPLLPVFLYVYVSKTYLSLDKFSQNSSFAKSSNTYWRQGKP